MAVIVTDTRTVITEADDNTGGSWTGGGGDFESPFVEATAAWVGTLNIATGQLYFTRTTSIDATDQMIYVWSNNFALQFGWLNTDPPNALHLGDGTNRISFRMAGADRKMFSHLTEQDWGWDCLLLDTSEASRMNTDGLTVARAGNFASLNFAALTQFGADFRTESKGIGGGVNVAVDIIRMGNNGLVITGGATGDRGKFIEIITEDYSTANLKAHGIIREYTTGIYGLQGPLTFGNATDNAWFDELNATVAFENRDVGDDKYYLAITGGTGETHFLLRNSSITTAGPFVRCDFDSNDIDELVIQNNTFAGLGNAMTFATDLLAQNHIVTANVFNAVGQIDPGVVEFENNTISNSTNISGSLILNNANRDFLINNTFNSAGTGHAILLGASVPVELTFTGVRYNGYGANDTIDATIYNNSGKAVTIFLVGGSDVPTVRNGTGASTTIIASVNVTVSGLRDDTEVRVYPAGEPGSDELAGTETAMDGDPDDRFFTFTLQAGTAIDIQIVNLIYEIERIENFIVPTADASIPIQQRFDRNYIASGST